MVAVLLALQLVMPPDSLPAPVAADSLGARGDSAAAAPVAADSLGARGDGAAPAPRIVRQFPTVTVRAPLHDMRSSETVQIISGATLRSFPVDRIADLVALKAGVIAQGEELHVRGGRAGDFRVFLSGVDLGDPVRGRAMELPLLALSSAEVVTGAPEAEFGGALAGVMNALTVDPEPRASGAFRWLAGSDATPRFDRVGGRLGAPLGASGLGLVASGEATLDDPDYPALRSSGRQHVMGGSFGWRMDNHMLGHFKLAPTGEQRPFALELVVNRRVDRPFDPMWTLDGWTTPELPLTPSSAGPGYSPTPVYAPGWGRYRAADHKTITDDRRYAALLSVNRTRLRDRWSGVLSWTHTRTITSLDGSEDESYLTKERGPVFGWPGFKTSDPFHVYFGDEPYFRRALSSVLGAHADYERFAERGLSAKGGVSIRREDVELRELDTSTWGLGLDSLRHYSVQVPGASAYVQTRWRFEGLVLNAGGRAEYFSSGVHTRDPQTGLTPAGLWSLSPRLGVAYPISARDEFSLGYVRIQQDPARDFLYDDRKLINNRRPLGNPFLVPSTVISYQGAIKHLFDEHWAGQGAVFYRDLFGQIGARRHSVPYRPVQMRYENADDGHASGFELSVIYAHEPRGRAELHYTYLDAFGSESVEDGIAYWPISGLRPTPIGEHPYSWDQRHTLAFISSWGGLTGWHFSWTTVAGSGLPWTPAELRSLPPDLSQVNARRFKWSETSALRAEWTPARIGRQVTIGCEVRNVFDTRVERAATVNGFPNPIINTFYDDYGAYRTETGNPGGAYWNDGNADGQSEWNLVHDPRLFSPPRSIRLSVATEW